MTNIVSSFIVPKVRFIDVIMLFYGRGGARVRVVSKLCQSVRL